MSYLNKIFFCSCVIPTTQLLFVTSCGQQPKPILPVSVEIDDSQKQNFFYESKNVSSFTFQLDNFLGGEVINAKITAQRQDSETGKFVKFENKQVDEQEWFVINKGQKELTINLEKISDTNKDADSPTTIYLNLKLTVISSGIVVFEYDCNGIQILLARPTDRSYFKITKSTDGSNILEGFDTKYQDKIDLCDVLLVDDDIAIIDDNAFYKNSKTTIPGRMKWIIFKNTNASFLQKIGSFAFKKSGLSGILSLPNTVTEIGEGAFEECTKLTGNLQLPLNLTKLGAFAFNNCTGLKGSITLPSKLEAINSFTFNNCIHINCPIHLPPQITKIGTNAFNNCQGIYGPIQIPSTVTEIGNYAFNNCSKLTSLTFEDGADKWSHVTYIGNYAFYNCTQMTKELVLPTKLITIGNYAFYNCSFNGRLDIPSTVTDIGESAFEGCVNFSNSLVFSTRIKNIGNRAFYNCSGFWIVDFSDSNEPNPTWLDRPNNEIFYGFKPGGFFFPSLRGAEEVWKKLIVNNCSIPADWTVSLLYSDAPKSVIALDSNNDVIGLKKDVSILPYNRLSIDWDCKIKDNAFANAFPKKYPSIFALNLKGGEKIIGHQTFLNCNGLCGTLDLQNVYTVGDRAFANCSNIGLISNIENITSIGESAFENCYSMKGTLKIQVPSSIGEDEGLGRYAFKNCKSIEVLDLTYYKQGLYPVWLVNPTNVFEGFSEKGGVVLIDSSNQIDDWKTLLQNNCKLPQSWVVKYPE